MNKEQNILLTDLSYFNSVRLLRFCTVIKEDRQTTVYSVWRTCKLIIFLYR